MLVRVDQQGSTHSPMQENGVLAFVLWRLAIEQPPVFGYNASIYTSAALLLSVSIKLDLALDPQIEIYISIYAKPCLSEKRLV
jgi:hypothetical protein